MATMPQDRYPTPRALADDLDRWMADEPDTAWREPLSRRARRWAQRNQTAVTALAASVLVALVGTAAVLAVQTHANRQLQRAYNDLAIANDRTAKANEDLKLATEREKQRFDLAVDAIKLFHGEVSEDLLMKEKHFERLRTKLLKGAADFYGRLEDLLKGQPDRGSRAELGNAYFELANLTGQIGSQTAALGIHRKALAVRRALAAEPGADAGTGIDVARSLNATGALQASTGDMEVARASYEESRHLAEEGERRGWSAEESLKVTGEAHYRTGVMLLETGDPSGALSEYSKSLIIYQRLADANRGVARFQQAVATIYNNVAYLLSYLGNTARAQSAYDKALNIRKNLADIDPHDAGLQRDLAWSHYSIGGLQSAIGELSAAQSNTGAALAIRQKLADENPNVSPIQSELADSLLALGWLLIRVGKPTESIDYFSREEAIWKTLSDANPTVAKYQKSLANCQTNLATSLIRLGRLGEARKRCERAVAICEALMSANPNLPKYRATLAEGLLRFGQVREAERDLVGALADWRRAVELFGSVRSLNSEFVFLFAACHALLSSMSIQLGSGISAGESDSQADRAMDLLRRAVAVGYRDPVMFRSETALDPLRSRDDFRLLLMDMAFPAEPFAQ
jgi:serine/threonine-protein kinase